MRKRWYQFAGVAAVALAADQASKMWAREALVAGDSVTVIDGFFDWHLSYNHGVAFNLFDSVAGARVLLSLVAVIAVAGLVWMVATGSDRKIRMVGLGLIAGGALGNLFDRLAHGKVTDFIAWHIHQLHWPVFNVADAVLLIGVPLLLLDELRARAPATSPPAAS